MPNLYEDAVMKQLGSIGQPITRKSTTVADLGGEGLDISTLLMLLFMSGILGGGGGAGGMPEPMLPNTPLPTTLDAQQLQPYPPPQVSAMGNVGGVPSLENIDIMSLINMFSRMG